MRDKSNKTIEFRAGKADKNFTEERLTSYTGLTVVSKYIQAQGIGKLLNRLFPTVKQNATKFSTLQIMLAVVLASMSDVHRMSRIENFTCDPLIQHIWSLKEDIDYQGLKLILVHYFVENQTFILKFNEPWNILVDIYQSQTLNISTIQITSYNYFNGKKFILINSYLVNQVIA